MQIDVTYHPQADKRSIYKSQGKDGLHTIKNFINIMKIKLPEGTESAFTGDQNQMH